MPGISIHVVDVSRGVVANGMRVELFAVSGDSSHRLIASGSISKTGVLADPVLNQRFEPGFYDARFHIADYYRARSVRRPRCHSSMSSATVSAWPSRRRTTICR